MFAGVIQLHYLCNIKKELIININMEARKYHIGRSGSGWGIWNNEGNKVMSCYSHFNAVENLYKLMGWNFNPSKYRRNF